MLRQECEGYHHYEETSAHIHSLFAVSEQMKHVEMLLFVKIRGSLIERRTPGCEHYRNATTQLLHGHHFIHGFYSSALRTQCLNNKAVS